MSHSGGNSRQHITVIDLLTCRCRLLRLFLFHFSFDYVGIFSLRNRVRNKTRRSIFHQDRMCLLKCFTMIFYRLTFVHFSVCHAPIIYVSGVQRKTLKAVDVIVRVQCVTDALCMGDFQLFRSWSFRPSIMLYTWMQRRSKL